MWLQWVKHCVDHPAAADHQTCRGVFYGSDYFLCESTMADTLVLRMIQPDAGSVPVFYCEVTDTCTQYSALVSVLHHILPPPLPPHSASCNACQYVFVHISKWQVDIDEVPLVQVAGDDHECKWCNCTSWWLEKTPPVQVAEGQNHLGH